jgi:hypothetical protein
MRSIDQLTSPVGSKILLLQLPWGCGRWLLVGTINIRLLPEPESADNLDAEDSGAHSKRLGDIFYCGGNPNDERCGGTG